jgi:hypothetical protein
VAIEHGPGGTSFTGEHIGLFRLLTMRSALRLEMLGMKHSRGSVYALVKREFGFTGNRAKVLAQLEDHIRTTWGADALPTQRG